MNLGVPRLHAQRCTRYRYRYSQCTRCADACPHGAVALDDEGASLDPARCQGCALCTVACPTDAWSSTSYRPIDLLRLAIRQPSWSLACAPSGAAADAVVPCLGAIQATMLAYVARRGLPLTLRGAGHCRDCVHGRQGAGQLTRQLEALDLLHEHLRFDGDKPWVMPVVEQTDSNRQANAIAPAAARFDPSRRQLFRRIVHRAAQDVAEATAATPPPAVPSSAIRPGPYVVPEHRDLLQIVCRRPDDRPVAVPLHDALPLMQITLRSGCTSCEACFRVCPTGALQIDENPGDWALTFQLDRCVGCQVCLEVCQPRVLDACEQTAARPEQPPVPLLQLTKQRCARCDRTFASSTSQSTCTVCSDDERAFDAIFG